MNTVVIIQARLTSTRLPGKVLMEIGGKPLLQEIWDRASATRCQAIVAIPDTEANNALADWLHKRAVPFVRGPEDDVLRRYVIASNAYPANNYVRLTADCPFVRLAPVNMISGALGYASTADLGVASGLDVECFTDWMLCRADEEAVTAFDREHVTHWMRRYVGLPENPPRPTLKLSVDTQEDLDRLREWYAAGVLR